MKVLVIEDSRILQAGIRRALTKAGHEVILSSDGQEGLDTARMLLPELVLLDMMLPTLAGTDVLKALKSNPATRSIPVFVLTGLAQKNEEKLLHAGAARYFEKSDFLLGHNFASLVDAIGLWASKNSDSHCEV
jgi:CheY-like chemotaxis protein